MTKWLLAIFFVSTTASAQYGETISLGGGDGWLDVGTGVLAYNMFDTSKDATGETGAFGTNYSLPIQLQAEFNFFWGFKMAPRLLFTPIGQEAPDKGSTSRILLLSLPLKGQITGSLKWTSGLGYMIRTIKGEGGTREVNNGLGTATFNLPGKSQSSKNVLFEAGLSYEAALFDIGLESLWSSLLSGRRSVSFLLTLNYQLL